MSEVIKKAKSAVLLYKLAYIKGFLYSLTALWTCWETATNNVNISTLTPWDWFQTIGGCIAAWILVIIAFLDKSAHQISEGQLPGFDGIRLPPSGETEMISRQQIVQPESPKPNG